MADKEFLYYPLKGVIPIVVLGCIDTQAILLGKIVEILILIFESKFPHALCFQDRWTWAMVRVFTNHEGLDSDLREQFEVPAKPWLAESCSMLTARN